MRILPGNIDLTANRDFGGTALDLAPILQDDLVEVWYDGGMMSCDDYNYMVWLEGIFGKLKHTNERWDLFGKPESSWFKEKISYTCNRCGKSIRAPWKNYHGLCKECSLKLEYIPERRVPWKRSNVSIRTTDMDIFHLR